MAAIQVLEASLPPSPETIHGETSQSHPNAPALFNPCGLAVSAAGAIYIADTGHHRICVLEDGRLRVLAGSGARGYKDGAGQEAAFAHPCGLVIDSENVLFVADCGNHRIRQVTLEGVVSTVAGNGTAAHRDGQGQSASFFNPCGIAIDLNDVLYVADYSNNSVRAVSKGGVVATLRSNDDDTQLDAPYGIAVHLERTDTGTAARVYVSSYHSNSLATLSPEGRIEILAGCGAARHEDGVGADAAFHAPNGLAINADGELYVADSGNHCVRKVDRDGTVITIAGTGHPGMSSREFNSPCGLCICILPEQGPVLLVTDRSNCCVRLMPLDALPPPRIAPSTLRDDLRRLVDRDDGVEGEIVFEVEGRSLRVSKAVLSVRCCHFRAMFTSGMRESSEGRVRVPHVSYVVFRGLIDYLVTDHLPGTLSTEAVLDLMMLANAYGVQRLEQLCELSLAARLSEQNAAELSRCAELIGACQLKRASAKLLAGGGAAVALPVECR
uniref:BTB domain-containing protein n=1 Tax=Calcidiscus leptoporus TaxID=127549 RepID=A0A6U5EUN1_9EUKA